MVFCFVVASYSNAMVKDNKHFTNMDPCYNLDSLGSCWNISNGRNVLNNTE